MPSLSDAYQYRLAAGLIEDDPAQKEAVAALQDLAGRLQDSALKNPVQFFLSLLSKTKNLPRGLYIYGEVGRGKSMLMDLFYAHVGTVRKRRVHFHHFMLEIHERLHQMRAHGRSAGDPLPEVAAEIARKVALLCFDEFHVSDIADAMILSRLFGALFDYGVVVVATSNWAPEDLYKDGLQRQRFLPFIDLLRARMDVLRLGGSKDHRLGRLHGWQVYFSPLGAEATTQLDRVFAVLTDGVAGGPDELVVQRRPLRVPCAAKGVARFSFADLCEKPLAAADYLVLAQCYQAVLLDGVPLLTPEKRNETMRFITLIDVLYENRVKLVMAAEAAPAGLCPAGPHAFAFRRTESRLMEMQAEDYWRKAHLG